jgi:C4-type Zn-finger protein
LKGAGCKMIVPELELELESGAMGSTLTTVEGLLEKVYEHLASTRPFTSGDSHATATSTFAKRLRIFLGKLDDVRKLRPSFTLILEDPLGHSNIEVFAV